MRRERSQFSIRTRVETQRSLYSQERRLRCCILLEFNQRILNWWRRGELNPRPRVFHLRDYMLSRCFSVTLGAPNGRVSQSHPV
jgi:hypothetical protein